MTVAEVLTRKRWMRLALPDDVAQLVALVGLLHVTEHRRAVELDYQLRLLRHEVWDRKPSRRPRRPDLLKPSKESRARGYRTARGKEKSTWSTR